MDRLRKPILVLIFGTEHSVNKFEKNWLIHSKPLINKNALIIHNSEEESLSSMLNLIIEESDISSKDYIFFVNKSNQAKDFIDVSKYINNHYRNEFKKIKVVFTYLKDEDHWSDEDVELINSISEKYKYSMSYGDLFDTYQLSENSMKIPQHISTVTGMLFDITDLSKFLYDETVKIDPKIENDIKQNIEELLRITNHYAKSVIRGKNEN